MVDYKERIVRDVSPIESPHYDRFTGLYFFLSLDLVNSTAYKAKNPDWKFRIRMFYDEAKDFWTNHQGPFQPVVWKYAGDEVLFYSRIGSVAELAQAVVASSAAVLRVCSTVEKWSEKSSTRLFVKGTCWCAYAEYQAPAPESEISAGGSKARNIVFQTPFGADGGQLSLDFLGPEIDAGFRISSASAKKALVVSAEMAGLLHKRAERDLGDRLRVIEYRQLKGVWDGRHYPIVWYRPEWSPESLERDYVYDDRFCHSALDGAYNAAAESCKALPSVLTQIADGEWLGRLELPNDAEVVPEAAESIALAPTDTEVHAVAICFTRDDKVLIAKRPTTKQVEPGRWEAGCAKLRPGEDFFQAMKRDYRADFSLELDFAPFDPWGVVGTYSFEKRGRVVPGVIFVARVQDGSTLVAAKHDDVRWADPSDLASEVVENCVPDLPERIRRAFELWKRAHPKKL